MHGAAITLAEKLKATNTTPDIIVLSAMMDVALFRSLLPRAWRSVPLIAYFHENQLSYPWSAADPDVHTGRDRHYAFINYTSALSADAVCWSSQYHMQSFLQQLPQFLSAFPDHQELNSIQTIKNKSRVLYPGLNLDEYGPLCEPAGPPRTILWNHRWEYDKQPEKFFSTLFALADEGIDFKLIVTGARFSQEPSIFNQARNQLAAHITHWGFVPDRSAYISLLHQADILPVTSVQDFFGYSVLEAVWCGAYPLLPKRLAYTEHFSDEGCFYTDDNELLNKLTHLLRHHIPDFTHWRAAIEHYDWRNLVKQYDSLFSTFAS